MEKDEEERKHNFPREFHPTIFYIPIALERSKKSYRLRQAKTRAPPLQYSFGKWLSGTTDCCGSIPKTEAVSSVIAMIKYLDKIDICK